MSGLSYLKGLRKGELAEFAESTQLPDYDSMKKAELESALDEHLRANQATYSSKSELGDYYSRLAPRSPTKRGSTAAAGEDPPKKPRQRRPTQVAQDVGVTSDSEAPSGPASKAMSKTKDLVKTPSRAISQRAMRLPPSPAVISDTIERKADQIKASIGTIYDKSGIPERNEATREFLSRSLVIHWIPVFVEIWALRSQILPSKLAGTIPSFHYIKTPEIDVSVPDLFLLLTQRFWAPASLWTATSLVVPLTVAYFFNLSLYTQPSGRSTRRSSSASAKQYDPIVYSITKALVSYLVYAQHWVPFGMFQNHTISTVNESVYGGYQGLITAAAVSGIVSLYDTILSK
ncbi:MAG: hypothetical protein Q9160_002929 [Pyrenula sp. 1 TL-2023]